MPVGISQPMNQIKLTNISLVRLKRGKKRFEIACYKNKVLEYRNGVESNIDEVLQIPSVFLNVSKGATAPKEDLRKAFGDMSVQEIVLEILNKGELQVGEKERGEELRRRRHEVVGIVAGMLVDPRTKRVYTPGMIEKALDMLSGMGSQAQQESGTTNTNTNTNSGRSTPVTGEEGEARPAEKDKEKKHIATWTGVVATKSAKSQALEAMKALIAQQPIPVMRARMRLRITCPTSVLKQAVKAAKVPGQSAADEDGADDDSSAEPRATTTQIGKASKGAKGKAAGNKGGSTAKKADADAAESTNGGGGGGGGGGGTAGTVKDVILTFFEQVESQDVMGPEWEVTGFCEPGAFKGLGDFIGGETRGQGRVEVLDMAVTHED